MTKCGSADEIRIGPQLAVPDWACKRISVLEYRRQLLWLLRYVSLMSASSFMWPFARADCRTWVLFVIVTCCGIAIFKWAPNLSWWSSLNFALSSSLRLLKSIAMEASLPSLRLLNALERRVLKSPPLHFEQSPSSRTASPHEPQNRFAIGNDMYSKQHTTKQRVAMETCKVRTPMQDGEIDARCEHQCKQQWTEMATDEN